MAMSTSQPDPETAETAITFVTIAFSGDVPLIGLQAHSMARFLPPDQVAEILLVLNDVDEPRLRRRLQSLSQAYGPHQAKLRIVSGDDVLLRADRATRPTMFERLYVENRFRLPFVRRGGWRGGNGYRMQQALKLASARAVSTRRMVILDGKNIFLRAPRAGEWFAPDGRARLAFERVSPTFHRNWLRESLDLLSVQVPLDTISETTGYTTPYPVSRDLLLDVLAEVEALHGSVQALFAGKRRPSEFMLIYAYCLKHLGGPKAVFEKIAKDKVGLWDTFDVEARNAALKEAETGDPLTFGLHRNAVAKLDPRNRGRLVALFAARGIDIAPVLPDGPHPQDTTPIRPSQET